MDAVRLKCQLIVFWFQERRWKEHHALPSVVHLFLCNCSFEGIFDSNDPDKNCGADGHGCLPAWILNLHPTRAIHC